MRKNLRKTATATPNRSALMSLLLATALNAGTPWRG